MTSRRIATALAGMLALVLITSACSSSTSSGPSSGGTKTNAAAGDQDSSVSATDLTSKLAAGLAKITSVHLDAKSKFDGQSIDVAGEQTLQDGKAKALDVDTTLPGSDGEIRIVLVDGKTYAKLPKSLSTSSKPWTAVRSDSKNPLIAGVAATLKSSLAVATVDQLSKLASALRDVRDKGHAQVDGVDTTHYTASVDPAKIPGGSSAKSALGDQQLPVDIFIDGQGRPIQIKIDVTVAGKSVTSTITFSKYNDPVAISAPPADQIDNG